MSESDTFRPLTSQPADAVLGPTRGGLPVPRTRKRAHDTRRPESGSVTPRDTDWGTLSRRVLDGFPVDRTEALRILRAHDDDILDLLAGAYRIRRHFFGNEMKLNVLISAQSGRCGEDCAYCSQSIYASSPVPEYRLVDTDTIVDGARHAHEQQAGTYCIVMSGRRASRADVTTVGDAVRRIKDELPEMKICACLGLIDQQKADTLADAGVDRFNHNVNTGARFHDQIVTTHTYQDRLHTLEAVKESGISPCSGLICGMGESDEDLVDAALDLRRLGADSIPVNFLIPQDGTPLEGKRDLTALRCLKIVSMFRYVLPDKEVRLAGGRELNLDQLQPMALYAANSIFLGDYLTSAGQDSSADYRMIEQLGFTIERNAHDSGPQAVPTASASGGDVSRV